MPSAVSRLLSFDKQRTGLLCAAGAASLGFLALIGWLADKPLLYAHFAPGRAATKPTAALALVLGGLALWLYTITNQASRTKTHDVLALGCTALWSCLALDALAFHFAAYDTGLAALLYQSMTGHGRPGAWAHMSHMGSVCIAALAVAQIFIRQVPRAVYVAQSLCLAVLVACTWAVIETLIQLGQFSGISLNAAAGYALLAFGTLLLHPPRWLDEVAFEPGPAPRLFRWLPFVVLGSILLSVGLEYYAQRYARLYATKDEIFVFLFTLAMAAAFYVAARMVRAADLQRQLELQRRHHEERYRLIVEASHDGILLVSAEGTILYMNPSLEQMLGYAPDELLGHKSYELVPPEGLQGVKDTIERSRTVPRQDMEVALARKDGSPVWTLVTVTTLNDDQGEQIGRLSIISDLSRLRHAEEARSRLEQEVLQAELEGVRKAVATYMHELNSPLAGLNSYVQMLLEEVKDDEQRQWLEDMQDACRRMHQVLRSMEDLKQLKLGVAGGHRGPLDLRESKEDA
jgi:PAS domain S-box-containing protein